MNKFKSIIITAMAAGAALAAPKGGSHKKDLWKYAGEDHGVRFFFQPAAKGAIRIKVENSMDAQVDVMYRVMDTEWKKTFASTLAPHAVDSTINYKPVGGGKGAVRFPYFDQVYLERTDGAASIETDVKSDEAGRT